MDIRRKIAIIDGVRYLVAFSLIFLFCLFISLTANRFIKKQAKDGLESDELALMSQFSQNIDQLSVWTEKLYSDSRFNKLANLVGEVGKNHVMDYYKLQSPFVEFAISHNEISLVLSLFSQNEVMLSSEHYSTDFSQYYGTLMLFEKQGIDLSSSQLLKDYLFSSFQKGGTFVSFDRLTFSNHNTLKILENPIVYLCNLDKMSVSKNPKSLVCFVIDSSWLLDLLVPYSRRDNTNLLFQEGRNGERVLSYQAIEDASFTKNDILCEETIANALLSVRVSSAYVTAFIDNNTKVMVHLLYIAFFAVVVLSLLFTLRKVLGFSELYKEVEKEGNSKQAFPTTVPREYAALSKKIANIRTMEQTYKANLDEVKKQNDMIRLRYMVVVGVKTDEEVEQFCTLFGSCPNFYCVVKVHCITPDQGSHQEEYSYEVFQQLYAKGLFPCKEIVSDDGDRVFIVELSDDTPEEFSALQGTFSTITNQFGLKYGIFLHVGISEVASSLFKIDSCYEQTKQVVRSCFDYDNQSFVIAYEPQTLEFSENPIDLDCLNHLYTFLVAGQEKDALLLLSGVFQKFKDTPFLLEEDKSYLFQSIKLTLYSVLISIGEQKEIQNSDCVYESDMTLSDMETVFHTVIKRIGANIADKKKSHNEELKSKILDFVEKHYSEYSLSVYEVSKEFNISEKYISQFIKGQTGYTFSEWLLKIRIDAAKKLLKETEYSNETIANMTGFSALNTFYRNFNKVCGISPKTFRETFYVKNGDTPPPPEE